MPNTTEKEIQQRGHCQCCVREHAVSSSGLVALHGYTVKNGWFQGTCAGAQAAPLEYDRKIADQVIKQVLSDCEKLEEQHDKLKEGYFIPEKLNVRRAPYFESVSVDYADCTPYERQEAIRNILLQYKNRIRSGESFIDMLREAIKQYYGKPLMQCVKKEAPEPILIGDTRVSQRGVLTVKSVNGGTVKWSDERGFIGKSTTRYWRQLPKNEENKIDSQNTESHKRIKLK